ncbi:MAG: hypothetical protein DRI69_01995 [Bacteroidetes bacterium]|nr:MAG: hypothetical protein DRI69_01995 [Bacteroidota bacterium]
MDNNGSFRETSDKIIEGLELAYKKLVIFKKQNNSPLIVSKNGEIIKIDPADIPPTASYRPKK